MGALPLPVAHGVPCYHQGREWRVKISLIKHTARVSLCIKTEKYKYYCLPVSGANFFALVFFLKSQHGQFVCKYSAF